LQGKARTGETRQRKAQQSKAREGNDGNEQEGKAREGNETHRREGRERTKQKIGGDATFFFPLETSEILYWNSIFMFIE
jgi:hypothetical protein